MRRTLWTAAAAAAALVASASALWIVHRKKRSSLAAAAVASTSSSSACVLSTALLRRLSSEAHEIVYPWRDHEDMCKSVLLLTMKNGDSHLIARAARSFYQDQLHPDISYVRWEFYAFPQTRHEPVPFATTEFAAFDSCSGWFRCDRGHDVRSTEMSLALLDGEQLNNPVGSIHVLATAHVASLAALKRSDFADLVPTPLLALVVGCLDLDEKEAWDDWMSRFLRRKHWLGAIIRLAEQD